MDYTISIYENMNGWLTGQCEQIPEAITEGKDIDDLMCNMYNAISEALEIRKEEFLEKHNGEVRTRRILYLPNEKNRIAKTPKRKRLHA
jgi:predicted RNase H-like HicB family nuclease